jgi:hypothetical protein
MADIYTLQGNILKPMVDDITARRKLKEARVHKKNLEMILKIVDLAISGLSYYEVYRTANNIVITLKAERTFLMLSITQCDKVIEKKGYA